MIDSHKLACIRSRENSNLFGFVDYPHNASFPLPPPATSGGVVNT